MRRRTFIGGMLGWAALAAASRAEESRWLAGHFLIARRDMLDPNFKHTVVLIVDHDERGAFGLVVNRTHGIGRLSVLLKAMGIEAEAKVGEVRLRYGGPVAPGNGFIVHSPEYQHAATRSIVKGLSVTSHPEVIIDIAAGRGPQRYLIALGYSGWAPGQLEAELAVGGWVTAPADPDIVLAEDDEDKWRRAIDRVPRDL